MKLIESNQLQSIQKRRGTLTVTKILESKKNKLIEDLNKGSPKELVKNKLKE